MLLAAPTEACSLLAQIGVPEWLSSAWYLLVVLLGFSLVVFFHELGHFLAAKWAGVRVERFAIGFGRELVGFTAGETRYSFNLLPLGGYVKMLGQEDFAVDKSGELKVRDDPGSFTSKPVGKRMVIVSAGVVMNLIFAAVAFTIINMLGQDQTPPIAGMVQPGSAAARAGLQAGDRIAAVNGKPISDFMDLKFAVVLSDSNEELELTVYRDGRLVEPKPRVVPEFKADVRHRQIGLGDALTRRILVSASRPFGYAPEDALRPNDYLQQVRIGGEMREVRDIAEVWQALMDARGLPIDLVVRRPTATIPLRKLYSPTDDAPSTEVKAKAWAYMHLMPSADDQDAGSCSLLGLVPRLRLLSLSEKGAAALGGLKTYDVIVRVGAIENPTLAEFQREVERHDDRDLAILVRRPGEANQNLPAPVVSLLAEHREALIGAARADVAQARQKLDEIAAAEQVSPDQLARARAIAASLGAVRDWVAWLDSVDMHLVVVRPRRPFKLTGDAPKPTLGITMILPGEDDEAVVSDVQETLRDRPSPARIAGVPRGAVIVAVDGKPMSRWAEITEAFRQKAGSSVQLELRQGDQWATVTFTVPATITTLLNLPPEATITEIAGRETAELKSASGRPRTATMADWAAVEATLKREVGKTVPVSYRLRDGTIQRGEMKVTPDNTDPWLMRVMYIPSFTCYPLREFVQEKNPIRAMWQGFHRAYQSTVQTYLTIKHIVFTREVGVENIQGPVGIIKTGSQLAEGGTTALLYFLAVISANLAVINFLPMPIVDGGLFVFLLLEKIRGEPVSIKTQVVTQLIGIALIVTLFVFVTIQDIANW